MSIFVPPGGIFCACIMNTRSIWTSTQLQSVAMVTGSDGRWHKWSSLRTRSHR